MEQNQEYEIISMTRIGDVAPEFKAVTTQGGINSPSVYKGKWIILFSHPADKGSITKQVARELNIERLKVVYYQRIN